MTSVLLLPNLKSLFLLSLVIHNSVDLCCSLPTQQTMDPSGVQLHPNAENVSSRTLSILEDFLSNTTRLPSIIEIKTFQDVLSIIKDDSSHVAPPAGNFSTLPAGNFSTLPAGNFSTLPAGNFSTTRELVSAFLRLDPLRTLRRILSQKPASIWFPKGPGVGDVCYGHLMTYFEGLIGRQNSNPGTDQLVTQEWALRMLDSVGKPSSGLLQGRLQLIGDYDQCVSVRAYREKSTQLGKSSPLFRGRYCRVRMPMAQYIDRRLPDNVNTFWLDEDHLPININWGVCVPDTCSQHEIKQFLTRGTFHTLSLPVEDVLCFQDQILSDDPGAVFVIVLLALLGLGVVLCTMIDLYNSIKDSNPTTTSPFWCVAQTTSPKAPRIQTTPISIENDTQKSEKENTTPEMDGRSKNPDLLKETTDLGQQNDDIPLQEKSLDVSLLSIKPVEPPTSEKEDKIFLAQETRSIPAVSDSSDDCQGQKGETNEAFEMGEIGEQGSAEANVADGCVQGLKAAGSNHSSIDIEAKNTDNTLKEKDDKEQNIGEINKAGNGKKSVCAHIIKGASLYTNFIELMNTDVSSSKRTIRCVEGLKAITMAWVVLGHTYTFGGIIDENNIVYDNALEMTNIPDRLAFHIGVGSAQFGVDTFFVICGCLVMFISLDKLKQAKKKWQFWMCFIFRRFWRLTPIYMVVLAIGTNLYDHMVYGPLKAHKLEEFYECREKWWAHLMYINNLYRPTQKCMTWTWYLAVDMQLHVLSPLFIYPVFRNRRLGSILIVCLLALSMVSAFFTELVYGGQFLLMDMNFSDYWSHVYTVPWARASAFAIGLLLGVILRDMDRSKPKAWEAFLAKKWCQRLFTPIMWTLNIGVGLALALVNHVQWRHGSGHWGNPSLAVFECLSRPLWSLAVAWVIFACNTGRAGPIEKILSFSPFVILSRLSYSVYLLHPLVILFVVYSRRTAIYLHPNRIDQAYNYLGNLVLTHLIAVVLYLFVEAPLRSLDILWEPRRQQKTD